MSVTTREVEAPTVNETARVLRRAAHLLMEHGWCQLSCERNGSYCAHAAIIAACEYDGHTFAACEAMDRQVGGHTQVWNDEPGRTAREVVDALLRAADNAETHA